VPQIAVEGELDVDGAVVLDDLDDEALRAGFDEGKPIVVRAASAEAVLQALKRPEVASVLVPAERRELLDLDLIKLTYGTYSIAACDLETGQWGVATQSKFLAVGSVVTWAEPHAGAVATQAYANPRYGPEGLALLREGGSADEVVKRLTSADDGRDHRQLGLVDREGRGASFTGSECFDWAGGRTGPGYAAQGNILVSAETVDALAETFERTAGSPLAERLLDCLDAAQAAGGDSRGQQSAALLVVEKDGGYANLSDVVIGQTPREEWVAVDEQLADELRERLARLGYEGELGDALFRWAGNENLEERVDGAEAIDPVVLEELRTQS
jgi:uncharacterized Ntn-hydrolase superfamily protein